MDGLRLLWHGALESFGSVSNEPTLPFVVSYGLPLGLGMTTPAVLPLACVAACRLAYRVSGACLRIRLLVLFRQLPCLLLAPDSCHVSGQRPVLALFWIAASDFSFLSFFIVVFLFMLLVLFLECHLMDCLSELHGPWIRPSNPVSLSSVFLVVLPVVFCCPLQSAPVPKGRFRSPFSAAICPDTSICILFDLYNIMACNDNSGMVLWEKRRFQIELWCCILSTPTTLLHLLQSSPCSGRRRVLLLPSAWPSGIRLVLLLQWLPCMTCTHTRILPCDWAFFFQYFLVLCLCFFVTFPLMSLSGSFIGAIAPAVWAFRVVSFIPCLR